VERAVGTLKPRGERGRAQDALDEAFGYYVGRVPDVTRLWDGVALWVALEQLEHMGIWRLNPAGPAEPWILVPCV
jgi:hypothetical protein